MTERLYYHDSFLREFDAQVLSVEPAPLPPDRSAGEHPWLVVLDCTAFYPTSGGQPHDTGPLGEAAVVDVFEREGDAVVHVTDRQLNAGPVHGAIDWERRFDHMQQHTGQHLLSAAFLELFKHPTVSFHLGGEVSTIDLAAPAIDLRQLEQAEQRTNQIVFEDRPVTVRFGTAEELAAAGIRKAMEREGILRAIEVEGFDRQPCGGTHVARTGQIGLILLRKCEKVKQNCRVEFVCGQRAARAARADFLALGEAARQLSCAPARCPPWSRGRWRSGRWGIGRASGCRSSSPRSKRCFCWPPKCAWARPVRRAWCCGCFRKPTPTTCGCWRASWWPSRACTCC